jgi:FkbM family methyltransferase
MRLGSTYGGWTISEIDLTASPLIYSFGIGTDLTFDLAMIERFDARVFAFDPTPRSLDWVKSQRLPDRLTVIPVGLADFDGALRFRPPAKLSHTSYAAVDDNSGVDGLVELPVKRLGTLMSELGHGSLDVLKMDIEGAEYPVIRSLLVSSHRPKQILVEFHHRFGKATVSDTVAAVNELRSAGYRLFHISESGTDYSFVHVVR